MTFADLHLHFAPSMTTSSVARGGGGSNEKAGRKGKSALETPVPVCRERLRSASTLPLVPRHDGFIADDEKFLAGARELTLYSSREKRQPAAEVEGRSVAVQLEVSDGNGGIECKWLVGKVAKNGYSSASQKHQVQFNDGDAPWIDFKHHIELNALCFLDRLDSGGKLLEAAADVDRVIRHREVSMELTELQPGVPSVYELDEGERHIGPIALHHSTLSMLVRMLLNLPRGIVEEAEPNVGYPVQDYVYAVLANP